MKRFLIGLVVVCCLVCVGVVTACLWLLLGVKGLSIALVFVGVCYGAGMMVEKCVG